MEEGLSCGLEFLMQKGLEVKVLVTDMHRQINKWLRETHPAIKHYYDVWHVAKGLHILRNLVNKINIASYI